MPASLAPVLAVLVAALTTFLTWWHARAPLQQLEKISAVVKDLPSDSPARVHLEFIQEDLARRINNVYRAPRDLAEAIVSWLVRLAGGVLVAVSYLYFSALAASLLPHPRAGHTTPTFWAVYAGVGVVFLTAGGVGLWLRDRGRANWIASHSPMETRSPRF